MIIIDNSEFIFISLYLISFVVKKVVTRKACLYTLLQTPVKNRRVPISCSSLEGQVKDLEWEYVLYPLLDCWLFLH